MEDQYRTLKSDSLGEFKDRGSKFIAYAYPVFTDQEWKDKLLEIRKLHFKARHHCYAYRLGLDKNNFRANDDGEPSGTAGRPILGQIDSFGLTNVMVVVVRYFGGTKLGTSGLINAYKLSTADALTKAEIIVKTVEDIYALVFDYGLMSQIMGAIKKLDLEIVRRDFAATAKMEIAIRKSEITHSVNHLRAAAANLRIEEIEQVETIPGFEMEYLQTR